MLWGNNEAWTKFKFYGTMRVQMSYGCNQSTMINVIVPRSANTKCWSIMCAADVEENLPVTLSHIFSPQVFISCKSMPARHYSLIDNRKWPPHQYDAIDVHLSHLSVAVTPGADAVWSVTSRSVMPLHIMWTHNLHCERWKELSPTPLQQTAQGYLL